MTNIKDAKENDVIEILQENGKFKKIKILKNILLPNGYRIIESKEVE